MQKSIAMMIVLAGFALGWSLALAQEAGARSAHGLATETTPAAHEASCPEAHSALPHGAAMADTSAARDAASSDGLAHAAAPADGHERDAAAQDAPAAAKPKAPATPTSGAGARNAGAALRWQSLLPGVMK